MEMLLSVDEFLSRNSKTVLPCDDEDRVDRGKIESALLEATGVIVLHCPFVLDGGGKLLEPLPAQFSEGLKAICRDLASWRLGDSIANSEEARLAYRDSLRTLERINEQHSGTLQTPADQGAELLGESGELTEDAPRPFWRGGRGLL